MNPSAHSGLHVRFPGETFVSQAEFDRFCADRRTLLEHRHAREQRMLPAAGDVVREGTCAPCLRVTRFTTPTDLRGQPDWREGQICGCADRLGHRARAALHCLESVAGLQPGSRVLLFSPPDELDRTLSERQIVAERRARLLETATGFRLDAPDARFEAVICRDHLQHVPPLTEALAEIRRVLSPGGSFVFSVPLRYRAARTVSHLDDARLPDGRLPAEIAGDAHEFGWDLLDRLREAGFLRPLAHHYWSEELGYLGPYNLLFSASV